MLGTTYMPVSLRGSSVVQETLKAYAVSNTATEPVGLLAGPFREELDALDYVGSTGEYIWELTGDPKTDVCKWYWEDSLSSWHRRDVGGLILPSTEIITHPLSKCQEKALAKLDSWIDSDYPFFVLRGYAGTGKTYLMNLLTTHRKFGAQRQVYFSAPTNKASQVLSIAVNQPTKTTYSMLGLRMEYNEDRVVLTTGKNPPYFPPGSVIVVDEASIVNKALMRILYATAKEAGIKILFVGDPYQLPPIGERSSRVWKLVSDQAYRASLLEVIRYDDQLLTLATNIRTCLAEKRYVSPLKSDHDKDKGVWKWKTQHQFIRNAIEAIRSDPSEAKLIAWRNKTVDHYNAIVREALGLKGDFAVNDRLLLTRPYERDGVVLAHTDEEFQLEGLEETSVDLDGDKLAAWSMHLNGASSLRLDVPKDTHAYQQILAKKANIAKKSSGYGRKTAWASYWDTVNTFGAVRHGFALTSHRVQGSTHKNVFVDQQDILANRNHRESFKSLYVGCTRATTEVHSF